MSDVTISVLGGFRLVAEGKVVTIPSKGVELISFLAIHSDTPTARDRVSGVLWPEFPQERALANLSTTLWRIRTAVGAYGSGLILKSRGAVILNKAEVDVDLWDFEENAAKLADGTVDRTQAARAVSLYTGDLLEGQCDATWLVGERERIRQTYVQALQQFGDREATAGKISEAIRAYELALKTDPLNEGVCRILMKLNASEGRRTEALRAFHTFRRNLHDELKLDPEVETIRLSETIKEAHFVEQKLASAAGGMPFEAAAYAPMVGRQAELQELVSLLSGVATESSQWIGLEGEIGIGKTRLVLEFCRLSRVRDYVVVYSRCPEFPQPAPYSMLKETLAGFSGLWRDIEAVVDEQSAATSTLLHPEVMSSGFEIEGRVRAKCSEIIAARLREEANQVPLVLVLEDIQYSDQASLELILNLQPLTRTHRLFTVLTWRSGDCPEAVSALIRSQYGIRRVIRLSRLDRMAVEMMCQNYLGISPLAKGIGDSVYEQSEGNPLFAIECLKTLRVKNRSRRLVDAHLERFAGPESGLAGAPAGIHLYIAKRLQMLSRDAAHLLRVAAACGREIEPQFLVKVMDFPLSRILHQLSSLVNAGFVVQSEDRFEFTHDRIRQLCYEQVPVPKWVRLHSRIYRVLKAFPSRLEALAFHSGRAGLSRESATYWELIGDRALAMWAHADACSAFSAALEQLERGGNGNMGQEHRFRVLRKRALAFEHGGELESGSADVAKMQEVAQDLADEQKSCEASCLESGFLLRQGVFGRALAKARIAGMIARNLGLSALEIQAGEIAALAMYRLGDYPRAEEELLKLGEILETSSDVEGLERIWNNLGRVQVVQGRHLQALDSLERAERYGTGDLHQRAMRSLFRGMARGCMARGDEAILEMNLAARDFARMGNWSGYALVNAYLSHFYVCKGDLVSGMLCGRKGLPFKAGRIDARWAWNSASTLSFGLWFILGNYRRAEREIARFLEADSVKGNPGVFLDTAAAIALERGKTDHAFVHAKEAVQRLSAEGGPVLADALLTLGRCYLAAGQPKEAVNALKRAINICEESSERLNFPRMWSFLAIAEADLGLTEMALVHSRRAVELLTESSEFAHIPQDVHWNHFLVLQNAGDPRAVTALHKGYGLVSKQASQLGRAGVRRFLAIRVNCLILDTWAKVLGNGRPIGQSEIDLKARHVDGARRIAVVIPSTGAPWGRPLRPSEYVEVIWTVDAGKRDQALKGLKGDLGLRRARILRLCAEANVQGGDPREEDLARVLGVTTRTIRSDIAYLRTQGCHVQTRGTNLH